MSTFKNTDGKSVLLKMVKGIRKEYYSEPTEDAYIMSLVSEEIE